MTPILSKHPHLADALVGALGIYDRATFDHSGRVSKLATGLGDAVRLDNRQVAALGWAGILHDVGKLAVPERVLAKTTPLTDSEWTQIKTHSAIGSDMLLSIAPKLAPVAEAVRSHHERWDGTGYPDGLAGKDIPLLGRIIALADVYDAVMSHRPYRKDDFSAADAEALIREGRGTHFDPSLVPVFLRLLRPRHTARRSAQYGTSRHSHR